MADLPKFATHIVNTLAATNASDDTVKEAYFFSKKLRYQHSGRGPLPSNNTDNHIVSRSTSQLDIDSRIDNFAALVKVVSAEPTYQPNEHELQISSLNSFVTRLHEFNKAVLESWITLSNARAARNRILYSRAGIYGAALTVKRYMKGAFGFESTAFEQVRGISFKNRKVSE